MSETAELNYKTGQAINFIRNCWTSVKGADDAGRSFLEKTGDVMFRGGQSPEAIAGAQDAAGKEYLAKMAASRVLLQQKRGLTRHKLRQAPDYLLGLAPPH